MKPENTFHLEAIKRQMILARDKSGVSGPYIAVLLEGMEDLMRFEVGIHVLEIHNFWATWWLQALGYSAVVRYRKNAYISR